MVMILSVPTPAHISTIFLNQHARQLVPDIQIWKLSFMQLCAQNSECLVSRKTDERQHLSSPTTAAFSGHLIRGGYVQRVRDVSELMSTADRN
ncbi:hypothetical protein GUJ93_ZPchr0006g46461 [Zizania palustris]|uniref:Uncharacterized protein n=1 Tax=Zizania palustris TaxID=103762 RepID=A0A8J5S9E9_ZIZPA|nr:hypothetical protein GUJ93_ZPchr0006g46461 [Zizania palustris]